MSDSNSEDSLSDLFAGFLSPPQAARPRMWWHWVNGNITKEGVASDLAWMKRVGIGGVTQIEISTFDPTQPQPSSPVRYLSSEWRDTLRYSIHLADALGLEFGIASSPGWSATGGPWVRPHEAMKKLVWSETYITGGAPFSGRIPQPSDATGLFPNIPSKAHEDPAPHTPRLYGDVATVAYRATVAEICELQLHATVTSSSGPLQGVSLEAGKLSKPAFLPLPENGRAWIQWSFPEPQRLQAITLVLDRPPSHHSLLEALPGGALEASDDGIHFQKVCDLPRSKTFESSSLQQTVAFSSFTAGTFRVILDRPEPSLAEQLFTGNSVTGYSISQLTLHAAARVNRFEDKAGYSTRQIVADDDTPAVSTQDAIRRPDIIDLTDRLGSDGSLSWSAPPGTWIVLRFGWSLLGTMNHPAPSTGKGLEVDKLDATHVRAYLERYLNEYEESVGPELIGARGLQHMLTDSYEAGPQNWTDDMLQQFRRRRGYDPVSWLPALTGRVVESASASDRFLWDFRKTIGELMADAYYGQISAFLHERGLRWYGESHENRRAFLGDGMAAKRTVDIPMGAIWAARLPGIAQGNYDVDLQESASVAHVFGKNIVAAESFTALTPPSGAYGFAPEHLKPLADRALAMGVNRFVIHTSVHQPDDKYGPGISLGPIGQWCTRKETWSEQACAWFEYLARSSYLLQQGRSVAGIAYLYGEDTNLTSLFPNGIDSIPPGYNFDFVGSDVLTQELQVVNGKLATRSGMTYEALVLGRGTRMMSLPILRRICDLARSGVPIIGAAPHGTPSLADAKSEFDALVEQLRGVRNRAWSAQPAGTPESLARSLAELGLSADLLVTPSQQNDFRFAHRIVGSTDIYFISFTAERAQTTQLSFRVTGKSPERWRAETGIVEHLPFWIEGDRTIVPLNMVRCDEAVFVVFAKQPSQSPVVAGYAPESSVVVDGAWDIHFPPEAGAPATAHFDALQSWTQHIDPGIRYFSGTAIYSRKLSVASTWHEARSRVRLDLGTVRNLAEVLVNGRSLGILWRAPFDIDITDAVHPGENALQVKVTNLWPNRLIGDKQPGARKLAFASYDPFRSDSPLLPSGLLGPVTMSHFSAR